MISRIEVRGLRALRYVSVDLEGFQVLVGPNGSGKSTLFDALLLVRDILQAGPRAAVLGDERARIQPRAVDPLDLGWMRRESTIEIAIEARIPTGRIAGNGTAFHACRYELVLQLSPEIRIQSETFWLLPSLMQSTPSGRQGRFPFVEPPQDSIVRAPGTKSPEGWRKVVKKVADSGNDYFQSETSNWNNLFRLGPARSALANLPADEEKFPVATWFKAMLLEGVQPLNLHAESMRLPCPPGLPTAYLPDGSNLAWVIHELETKDPDRLQDWIAHVRTALPDLRSVRTVDRPEDRKRYFILGYDSGLEAPSWTASDGTLRMLALTLLAYAEWPDQVILIEEPENGIHPRAVETVLEALSRTPRRQILCATHSPVVVGLVPPERCLCFAKTSEGATDIVSGRHHPRLAEWKGTTPLGDLFAAGVLS